MERVDPPVHTVFGMEIAPRLTRPRNPPHATSQPGIIGEAGATIAIAPKRLGGEKAGGTDRAQAATATAMLRTPEALGAVFDHRQTISISDGINGREISRLAIQAHRDDRLGTLTDRLLQLGRIQVVGGRIDVHVHRHGTQQGIRFRCGNEGKGFGDHLIPCLNTRRHQNDQHASVPLATAMQCFTPT